MVQTKIFQKGAYTWHLEAKGKQITGVKTKNKKAPKYVIKEKLKLKNYKKYLEETQLENKIKYLNNS